MYTVVLALAFTTSAETTGLCRCNHHVRYHRGCFRCACSFYSGCACAYGSHGYSACHMAPVYSCASFHGVTTITSVIQHTDSGLEKRVNDLEKKMDGLDEKIDAIMKKLKIKKKKAAASTPTKDVNALTAGRSTGSGTGGGGVSVETRAAQPATATITVKLPANARLLIDGHLCPLTSNTRIFTTPDLQPGQKYGYTFRMEVTRGGRTESDSRRIPFAAGETVVVDFNKADLAQR